MESDEDDLALLRQEKSAPSEAHDKAVLAAIDAAGQRIAGRKRRRMPVWRMALPLAAAASLLLVPFWLGNQDDPMRNASNDAEIIPGNASELAQSPEKIEWPAQPDADAYRFTLRTSDGNVLLEATTERTVNSIELSAADRDRLLPGHSYFWVVNVDNSVQRQIGPYWFSIKPMTLPERE